MANDEVPHPGHVKEGRGGVEGPRSGGLVQWVSYSLRSELVCNLYNNILLDTATQFKYPLPGYV